mgnify:CR=1 FL=1
MVREAQALLGLHSEQQIDSATSAYVTARGRLPIGELPIDAIFSPVRRVNYDVERARVGQMTNYDRLIVEIWTDGTIRALRGLRCI